MLFFLFTLIAKVAWLFAVCFHVSEMTFSFFAVFLFFPVGTMFSLVFAVNRSWTRWRNWKKNIGYIEYMDISVWINWSLWLIPRINSYHCDDFHISWMDIACKHNIGSNHWSSLTVYHCNLYLCCNTIFLCCRHICVSSGILLKWNNLIDDISVDFDSLNIT